MVQYKSKGFSSLSESLAFILEGIALDSLSLSIESEVSLHGIYLIHII